ncbi:ADP-ribosylation [Serendipita vermifera]|nr:ADP-ribosylation [Serendipita vermifera]
MGSQPKICQLPGCSKAVYPGSRWCSRRHMSEATSITDAQLICAFPGCRKPVYSGSKYCSLYHRDNAPGRLIPPPTTCSFHNCRKPVHPGSLYCSIRHRDQSARTGVTLQELKPNENDYKDVEKQFIQKWLHNPNTPPTIDRVYRIHLPTTLTENYEAYRGSVEETGNFISQGLAEGNERRRFHGTKRECRIGDNGNTKMCKSLACSLCRIMKHGFDLSMVGAATGFSRFGRGVYTSATSSKSDWYSVNLANSTVGGVSSLKAMLLTKVVVGKGKKLLQGDVTLTSPPPGFNSVIGEPAATAIGDLNYDELVVYDQSAVVPAFLIIYQR